jgi:hypothetical protein
MVELNLYKKLFGGVEKSSSKPKVYLERLIIFFLIKEQPRVFST